MGVFFNKNRTLRQYLGLVKYFVLKWFRSIPYRLTAKQRSLPDFLIVGVMKGGTSSLYHYLNQHPEVNMSREQEVHFFAKYFNKGLNYYRSYFPKKSENKVTGESSPYYFFHPLVPQRIKSSLPECKIILLLRDPVDRAFSHYQMHKGIDTALSFEHALELENSRVLKTHQRFIQGESLTDTSHQAYSYVSRGMYYEQLSRWLEHYDLDELLVLKSEDFFSDPKSTLKLVYNYLNLKEVFPNDLAPVNQRKYDAISEDTAEKLANLFKEDGEMLQSILGEHFSWRN